MFLERRPQSFLLKGSYLGENFLDYKFNILIVLVRSLEESIRFAGRRVPLSGSSRGEKGKTPG
jgi:hypothetical protein